MEKITDLVEEHKDATQADNQATDTQVRPANRRERRERSRSDESCKRSGRLNTSLRQSDYSSPERHLDKRRYRPNRALSNSEESPSSGGSRRSIILSRRPAISRSSSIVYTNRLSDSSLQTICLGDLAESDSSDSCLSK